MNLKKVDDIIQKCDICLGKAVISDEYIMESFLGFLTGTVSDENCSGRGIALHIIHRVLWLLLLYGLHFLPF